MQDGFRAVFPKGKAREDWAIIRALSDVVERTLPYDDLDGVRAAIRRPDAVAFDPAKLGKAGKVTAKPFASPIIDYYLTNPITRASATMAACAANELGVAEAAE
jgi:NADH-quinone oxidoreductase subunit G